MKECEHGQRLNQLLLCQSYLREDGSCHCGQVDQKYHGCTNTSLSIDKKYTYMYSIFKNSLQRIIQSYC